jgi:hypothetical protein
MDLQGNDQGWSEGGESELETEGGARDLEEVEKDGRERARRMHVAMGVALPR